MKKIISLVLVVLMLAGLCSQVVAIEESDEENFTTEELLAMDQALDTDGDGLTDVFEILYGANRYICDTDNDGVSDYIEFYVTHTELTAPDGDADSDLDGICNVTEIDYGTDPGHRDTDGDRLTDYDEIFVYGTNPLLADTDGDGLYDYDELVTENPLSLSDDYLMVSFDGSTVSPYVVTFPVDFGDGTSGVGTPATINRIIDGALYPTSVSYTMDYKYFFLDNKTYYPNLAVISSILSADAYDDVYLTLDNNPYSTTIETSLRDWMHYYHMKNYVNYDLTYTYGDQHISEMHVASREVTQSGITKNIICVVIRGTNGTLSEWQSNFDIGTTALFHNDPNWTNSNNHQGFDITANRLNDCLDEYIEEYASDKNNVIWITGHSRGGALANILAAKRIDEGDRVFAYTFASPATTTYISPDTEEKYDCIFNLINEDDYVVKLPLMDWDFKRYGVDKLASVNDSYKAEWNDLTPFAANYNCDEIGMDGVLEALAAIANDRNDCYVVEMSADHRITGSALTLASCQSKADQITAKYTENMDGAYYVAFAESGIGYSYYIYHKPVFFMQMLAAIMAGEMAGVDFVLRIEVAPYLREAKRSIASAYLGGMTHPHYPETYYLLATKIS